MRWLRCHCERSARCNVDGLGGGVLRCVAAFAMVQAILRLQREARIAAALSTLTVTENKCGGVASAAGSCADGRAALAPYSLLSMFQKIGVAGPSSTPVSDFRQALGIVYWPSGT